MKALIRVGLYMAAATPVVAAMHLLGFTPVEWAWWKWLGFWVVVALYRELVDRIDRRWPISAVVLVVGWLRDKGKS